MPYQQPHWDLFAKTRTNSALDSKQSPSLWAKRIGLNGIPNGANLSTDPLNRAKLHAMCKSPKYDVLHAYVCCMAWGGQNAIAKDGTRYAKKAWECRAEIAPILSTLRIGRLSRLEAYHLFVENKKNKFPGLGPSYFTKLIHFFSPGKTNYIIDNFVLKSIEVLTGLPHRSQATPGGYVAACWEIDQIATILHATGEDIEIGLFSGRGEKWRKHCNGIKNLGLGNAAYKLQMNAAYSVNGPKIPPDEFCR